MGSLEYSSFCLPLGFVQKKVSSAFFCGDDIVLVSILATDPHCRASSSLLLLGVYCDLFPKDPYYQIPSLTLTSFFHFLSVSLILNFHIVFPFHYLPEQNLDHTDSTQRPMGQCPLASRGFELPAKLPQPLVLSVIKLPMSILLQKASQQRSWAPQAQRGRL